MAAPQPETTSTAPTASPDNAAPAAGSTGRAVPPPVPDTPAHTTPTAPTLGADHAGAKTQGGKHGARDKDAKKEHKGAVTVWLETGPFQLQASPALRLRSASPASGIPIGFAF